MGTCCSCALVSSNCDCERRKRAWAELRIGARNFDGLLRRGELLFGGLQFAFRHARSGVNGVELIFGDVVGGEQRRVALEIALGAFVGGLFGGDVGFGDLQVRGGGLLELRLGHGVIGGVGLFLRGGAVGAIGGGCARQTDLHFCGICLGLGEIEIGFGLFDFGLIFAGIDLDQEVAFFDGRVVVDEKLNDVARDLRGDGGDVAVYLGVVGGNAAGKYVPSDGD